MKVLSGNFTFIFFKLFSLHPLSSIALLNGKTSEAEKECQNAIDILGNSDYGTELLKTYAFACNNKILNREDLWDLYMRKIKKY